MQISPVLSPSGEPLFTAGGRHAWKVAEHRGWVASLEWARRRRKTMRMLVIWPASNVFMVGARPGMWAISEAVISTFVGFDRDGKCTGSGSTDLYREALEALPMLGKDRSDKQAFLSLVDTVIKYAPDLVLMPAAPPRVRNELKSDPMWDVSAVKKSTGKTISEASV